MAKKLKTLFTNLLTKWLEDFLVFTGLGFIIYTTYSLNIVAGNYLMGFVFLLFGLILAKK